MVKLLSEKLRLNARAVTRDMCHHRAAPGAESRDQLSEYCAVSYVAAQWQWPRAFWNILKDLMRPLPSTSLAAAEPSASEGQEYSCP